MPVNAIKKKTKQNKTKQKNKNTKNRIKRVEAKFIRTRNEKHA